MMLRSPSAFLLTIALVGAAPLSGACTPSLSSPPAHAFHFASPASTGDGATSVTVGAGAGGEVFGPGVFAAEAQVRHGATETLDVGASASAGVLLGDQLADPPHRGVYAMRVFTHYNVVPKWLALHVGAGGGASAAGGYFAPDIGLTLGYENRYVVPYLYGSFVGSVPLTERTLDLALVDDTDPRQRVPYATIGAHFGGGLRIPVGPRDAPVGSIFVEFAGLVQAGDDPGDDDGFETQRGIGMGALAYQHRFGGAEASRQAADGAAPDVASSIRSTHPWRPSTAKPPT